MNLRQLEFFVALAETEHMTKVAKKLNTSQPNISHAIASLEQELGIELIEKKGRNVVMTYHGKVFYDYIAPALQKIADGEQRLREIIDPDAGEIQLGFIFTLGAHLVPSLVKKFQAQVNNKVQFEFHQGNSNQIIQLLLDNEIDLGLCSKVSDHHELNYELITKEEVVIVVPNEHPLAQCEAVSLSATSDFPYVYYNKKSGLRPFLDQVIAALDLKINITCELEEDHSILGFVGNGFGIAIMPDIASIASYPVKKLRITDALPDRQVYLVSKQRQTVSPAIKKFREFCLQELREQ